MQEEVTQKTMALAITTSRMTASVLAKAMRKFLEAQKNKSHQLPKGKQTLKELMKHNTGVSNLEITNDNIRAFSATAKKYGIDFALKKDNSTQPPRYLVFFKGRDADVMTAAFKEFSAKQLSQEKKPSIRKLLSSMKELVQKKDKVLDRTKHKDRGDGAMKQVNVKKLLILNLPYLLFVWLFDKAAQAVRLSPGADLSGKLLNLGDGFSQAMESIAPSFHPADLLAGLIGAVVIRLIIYTKGKNAKKYRKGMEYGSARWGTPEDIKPYIDPVFENNVLLTQTERLMMSNRPKNPKYARNKNILVIGGSGSGKTRFFVKPNLMQLHSSYVVTDPNR